MPYLVQAIVRKCKKGDEKPNRPWCVYKPKKSGSKQLMSPQPKGFPKTYEKKKDAEYGVKMMKTFGGSITPGWYLGIMLPKIYTNYIKNLNSNQAILSSIKKDPKIKTFLEAHKEEIPIIISWLPKFHKLKANINNLKDLQIEIASVDLNESKKIAKIYKDLIKQIAVKVLKKEYNKKIQKTVIPNLSKAGVIDYSYDESRRYPTPRDLEPFFGPSIEPNRDNMIYPRRRRFMNIRDNNSKSLGPRDTYYLCPECRLRLFRNTPVCPFCGENPLNSIKKFKNSEDNLEEVINSEDNLEEVINSEEIFEEIKKLKDYLGLNM